MSHAEKADKLLIKPAAGARPAPPRTRGRFIPKARTRRPVTRRVTRGTATTRLAMAPDRPTQRVLPSPEAWQKQAIEFLLWETRSTIPPLSSVPEQSAAEADRAANALPAERAAQLVRLLLGLLGLPLLFHRLLSRLLFHALLRVLVLGRHVLTSVWVRVRLSAVAQDVHQPLAAQVSLHLRRGSAGRIVATPSSSTSTT